MVNPTNMVDDRVMRPRHIVGAKKFCADRNDLMMSVYLPYCEYFLSNDREQIKSLREVASTAAIDAEVLLLEDFDRRMSVSF